MSNTDNTQAAIPIALPGCSVDSLNGRAIIITDARGDLTTAGGILRDYEPEPGSIVLANGEHGTAWQRAFTGDRLWYSTMGGGPKAWRDLRRSRNLSLIYAAKKRKG